MKVQNMTSARGNEVPNQFVITTTEKDTEGSLVVKEVFQSYNSVICIKRTTLDNVDVELDSKYWDYSTTTGKYRNQFLGEDKATTAKKIKSGEYVLTNLN